jgi:hypothetical protein
MTSKRKWHSVVLIVLLTPLLLYAAWCGREIYNLSSERTAIKKDYAEVNNIEFGLLSVDAWSNNISEIVIAKIKDFNFTHQQKDTLEKEINKVLNKLVTQAVDMVNEKQKTLGGKLKKFAFNTFVNVDHIRARIPEFTNTIIVAVTKPESKKRLQFMATEKLSEMTSETCDSLGSVNARDSILLRYKMDQESFNKKVVGTNAAFEKKTYHNTFILIGIILAFILVWVIVRKQTQLYTALFIMSVLLALIVLVTGLTSPMIEIDARIKELNFMLLGKSMIFKDQILFYQSKSILDVIHILIMTKKADSMLVGGLIFIFSVIFPITKLLTANIYLLGNNKIKKNNFVRFFAFKSGKWSMADVMVIAIFMAYIGFKGILESQLEDLNMKTKNLSTIATNETALQPGFILFVSFVLFSLLLSVILKKITTDTAPGTH